MTGLGLAINRHGLDFDAGFRAAWASSAPLSTLSSLRILEIDGFQNVDTLLRAAPSHSFVHHARQHLLLHPRPTSRLRSYLPDFCFFLHTGLVRFLSLLPSYPYIKVAILVFLAFNVPNSCVTFFV